MEDQKKKRRIRYSGKYPKRFEEKYKELNPTKYEDIIMHVIEKGNTPAGMHRSIMVDEILAYLDIKAGDIGLDVTLGFGGHSKVMLEKLNHSGHLYAIDQDPIELPKTRERLLNAGFSDDDFTLKQLNFKDIDSLSPLKFDFILADLGVSSMQIDDPSRGFTFKHDGPLDLRMNPNEGISAAVRLNNMTKDEIEGMLVENADEIYAKEIAEEIMQEKKKGTYIDTTKKLYEVIKQALRHLPKHEFEAALKKASTRTFQALRIDVNYEYEALFELLDKLPDRLKPNGRVCILTFHSGEDRMVKKAFKHFHKLDIYEEIEGPILPSKEETFSNPRSRFAKLRCAKKK